MSQKGNFSSFNKTSPRDIDMIWDMKKDLLRREAELLKENALLKQKIELQEEEIQSLKEREEN